MLPLNSVYQEVTEDLFDLKIDDESTPKSNTDINDMPLPLLLKDKFELCVQRRTYLNIDSKIYNEIEKLSVKTEKTKHEIVNLALKYALDHLEVIEK